MAVEANNPETYGNLGGLGLPALVAWPVGGLLAAAAAWAIGKTALGLRSDYLAIATLGIAEIIIAVLKNEDWLARGVKNVITLPRPWPVPYEVDLQQDPGFLDWAAGWGLDPVADLVDRREAGLCRAVRRWCCWSIVWLSERALRSPWGRMMRAIRDNEVSAEAMGKDVTRRHLQVFILGSAVRRHRGRDDDHAGRPADPRHLFPAAFHLPDLGDGDRRRVGEQLGRGAGRLPDLVALGHGRAAGSGADGHHHRRAWPTDHG